MPPVTVMYNDVLLSSPSDYTLSWSGNINAGEATITITFAGNYLGTATYLFEITPATLTITPIPGQFKTFGSEDPEIAYDHSGLFAPDMPSLIWGALSRAGGDVIGIYTITIGTLDAGQNYAISLAFETFEVRAISGIDETDALLSVTYAQSRTYTASAIMPSVTVMYNDVLLSSPSDYTVSWSNNINAGEATITITFAGNYLGTATYPFEITPATLTITPTHGQYKIFDSSDPAIEYSYSGLLAPDMPSLIWGALSRAGGEAVGSYTITIGTLNAGQNYTISLAFETFEVRAISGIDENDPLLEETGLDPPYIYTGSPIAPPLVLTYNGVLLVENVDYTLAYQNNTNIGTATVTVTLKGNYSGIATYTYEIIPPGPFDVTVTSNESVALEYMLNGDGNWMTMTEVSPNVYVIQGVPFGTSLSIRVLSDEYKITWESASGISSGKTFTAIVTEEMGVNVSFSLQADADHVFMMLCIVLVLLASVISMFLIWKKRKDKGERQ
ncbi:MAG: hypothetical protein LBI08_01490, partial [Methanomassiliicoccaceae archaeon]|jgi:hypothetical protein|nr:hypothetical protein [Methanomassiliicoccaceae archaeon]